MSTTQFNLQQEADYVLGMMDMYQKDEEISAMLKLKGLSNDQISKVLASVRGEGYEKRIRQGKKILWIGLAIAIVAGIATVFLWQSDIYVEDGTRFERRNSGRIIGIAFYGFLYGIIQTAWGAYRVINYSTKLRKLKHYI
jgi:hypothetical protein